MVVVGYGTMKKKDLLGATSMVSGDQLATNSSISVGGALQGKMSGINILSSSGFLVQKHLSVFVVLELLVMVMQVRW